MSVSLQANFLHANLGTAAHHSDLEQDVCLKRACEGGQSFKT